MVISQQLHSAMHDPRSYQIVALSSLLALGIIIFSFSLIMPHILSVIAAVLVSQYIFTRASRRPFAWQSALITGLSLCLLLRVEDIWIAAIAAVIAITSKFLIRYRGKHIFNPANIGIVTVVLLSDAAWISPGQWGNAAWIIVLMTSLAAVVLHNAKRLDSAFCFLTSLAALLMVRALWLGDPLSLPLHNVQNGAVLVFAFFMLSDPMTTPNHPQGRALHAFSVALIAFTLQTQFFISGAPLYALAIAAPFVALIDRGMPAPKFQWHKPPLHARP